MAEEENPRWLTDYAGFDSRQMAKMAHLEHMEDGEEKAADDRSADVFLFFPGKPPDLSKYFNHTASPSFAPMWAFHLS